MAQDPLDELGPIDYAVLEWPVGSAPSGEAAPLIVDLVDRGIIRIIDIAFIAKGEDGSVAALDLGSFSSDDAFAEFDGASSGLLGDDDLEEAGAALEPGETAAVIVWENRFLAPIAAALRRSGGQLVATGRIPAGDLIAALDIDRGRLRGATMPGLIRGVARTAVIAGTATAVSNRVSRRQAQRWAAQERAAAAAGAAAAAAGVLRATAAAARREEDPIEKLRELASLRDDGILTDEEFADQKRKLLGLITLR